MTVVLDALKHFIKHSTYQVAIRKDSITLWCKPDVDLFELYRCFPHTAPRIKHMRGGKAIITYEYENIMDMLLG